LESLASAALQRGIDAYRKKDYATAVKEFKRSVGIGRGSSFAADAANTSPCPIYSSATLKTPSRPINRHFK